MSYKKNEKKVSQKEFSINKDAALSRGKKYVTVEDRAIAQTTGQICSSYHKTRSNFNCTSWSDDRFVMANNMIFTWSHTDWGAGWASDGNRVGYNATYTSMTAGSLDALIRDAILTTLTLKELKDVDATQYLAWHRTIFASTQLLVHLAYQAKFRELLKLSAEDDALGSDELLWTLDGWRNFIGGLEYRKLPIPNLAYGLARTICVYWLSDIPYDDRSMPESYYFPFINSSVMTLTLAEQLRDFIMGRAEGLIFASKFHQGYKPFTVGMLSDVMTKVPSDGEVAYFHKYHNDLRFKDAGATATWAMHVGDFSAQDEANQKLPIDPDGKVHDIWALSMLIGNQYTATHSPFGSVENDSNADGWLAANEIGISTHAKTGTAFVHKIEKSELPKVMKNNLCLMEGVTFSLGANPILQDLDTALFESITIADKKHYKSSISQEVWTAWLQAAVSKLNKGELIV